MLKFPSKHASSFVQTQRQRSKDKGGRFSRKPQVASFTRRGQEGFQMAESISELVNSPRQKSTSQVDFFTPQLSQKHLNGPIGQQIKFLSPKNDKDYRMSASNLIVQSQKSPRFSRKSQWQAKKKIDTSIATKINENDSQQNFTPKISQMSLESVLHKQNESTVTNTQDWSGLERENIQLKSDNKKLREQNAKYLKRIKTLMDQQSSSNVQKVQKSGKCKNCLTMQQQIKLQGKYLKLFESTITSKQKQLQTIKSQLVEARMDIDKERNKYHQTKDRLKQINEKYKQESQINEQLQRIILSLKKKLDNSEQQKRSLGIQQNILLKKNQELEQMKVQIAKINTQKQNLKEQITTYKTRLSIINALKNKKKVQKLRHSKDLDNSDFFDLSSEQSDYNE